MVKILGFWQDLCLDHVLRQKAANMHVTFRDNGPNVRKPGSSVGTVSDYGLDGRSSTPRHRQSIFPLPSASRPALGPTQPPVQWVQGAFSPGVKGGCGMMLTTHPLLVPRLRKSRSYTSCHPNAPLWSVTGPLYLLRSEYSPSVKITTQQAY
jgi:hypothetical protein